MTEQFTRIRRIAQTHHISAVRKLHRAHKHTARILRKHQVVIHRVRDHSLKTAALASISTGLLATPLIATAPGHAEAQQQVPDMQSTMLNATLTPLTSPEPGAAPVGPSSTDANQMAQLRERLSTVAPGTSSHLTLDQEAAVTQVIQETFGITAKAELEGIRLNVNRGIIAGEQHLPLYPGDPLSNHFKNRITKKVADPTANLTGMVPGLPSWGYFAPNAASVTPKDVEREQWYMAAQTFLSPGWQENTQHMYKWFKYRKMLVINPSTGQAVVTDIGDAGPSPFTKRSFGGSNEVLISLGLGVKRTGNVMVLFVDDPTDAIPLGPLTGYQP